MNDKMHMAIMIIIGLFILGVGGVAVYHAAIDPCRCLERKCWTTIGISMPDSNGIVHPTTSVSCRCIKKWCPAEAMEDTQ
jgi:hypothetical protein